MNNIELEKLINHKLNSYLVTDYAPNGLQVEGKKDIKKIITGVTASQELLDIAVKNQADAVIVHHGYFWKQESSVITDVKRKRLKTLLNNDINLYAWHLPLDMHPELGNNAQISVALDIMVIGMLDPLVPYGKFVIPIKSEILLEKLEKMVGHHVIHFKENASTKIKRLAWCTGKGQNFVRLAARANMDAFISGEISEDTIFLSKEMGINFYAAGHHSTERGGIRALGEWLKKQHNFDVNFIDITNPA